MEREKSKVTSHTEQNTTSVFFSSKNGLTFFISNEPTLRAR